MVKAAKRRVSLESEGGSQFAVQVRRKRSDCLSDGIVQQVESWWFNETRVSPNQKDTVTKNIGRNEEVTHALHLLLET